MKKTLLAAAMLTTFAGVAQAETSVTLYGVIDTGIGYNKIKGNGYDGSKLGMINGIQAGSRWGLRGSEDLGLSLIHISAQRRGQHAYDDEERVARGAIPGRDDQRIQRPVHGLSLIHI